MQQLSGLDASFLALDTDNGVGHLCLVAEVDGELSLSDVRDSLARRIHLLPILRQRLKEVPLGLGRPYWMEDPSFSLPDHLFEGTLRAPGGPEELTEYVTRIASEHLDRTRPLWELHLVHGVEDGRTAVVTKIHHAAIDGVAGVELLSTMLDSSPVAAAGQPAAGAQPSAPSTRRQLVRSVTGLADLPLAVVRVQRRLLSRVPGLSALAMEKAVDMSAAQADWLLDPSSEPDGPTFAMPRISAPRSPFNASVGVERSLAVGKVELDEIRPVREAFGVTVNDVVLAATTAALRRWLDERDALPSEPLRAVVPVSVRAATEPGAESFGNLIALTSCALPVTEADPVARLQDIHASMLVAKQHHAISADNLQDATRFALPALATRALRLAARLRLADRVRLPFNLMVSNVPGPRQPFYLCGREVLSIYPVPTISDGLGLNVTVQGYLGRLNIGLVTAPHIVEDVWQLMGYLVEGFQELTGLATSRPA